MREKELIQKIKYLQRIEPRSDYSRLSRSLIVSSAKSGWYEDKQNPFIQSLTFAFSLGLVAVFLVTLIWGGTTGFFKQIFLPPLQGVTSEALVSEADALTKDIDIQLKEIAYFKEANKSVALNLAPPETPPENPITSQEVSDKTVDQLLEQVINY
jgi:hypothetical protein